MAGAEGILNTEFSWVFEVRAMTGKWGEVVWQRRVNTGFLLSKAGKRISSREVISWMVSLGSSVAMTSRGRCSWGVACHFLFSR